MRFNQLSPFSKKFPYAELHAKGFGGSSGEPYFENCRVLDAPNAQNLGVETWFHEDFKPQTPAFRATRTRNTQHLIIHHVIDITDARHFL